jgi:hypothetical protein
MFDKTKTKQTHKQLPFVGEKVPIDEILKRKKEQSKFKASESNVYFVKGIRILRKISPNIRPIGKKKERNPLIKEKKYYNPQKRRRRLTDGNIVHLLLRLVTRTGRGRVERVSACGGDAVDKMLPHRKTLEETSDSTRAVWVLVITPAGVRVIPNVTHFDKQQLGEAVVIECDFAVGGFVRVNPRIDSHRVKADTHVALRGQVFLEECVRSRQSAVTA